MHLEKTELPFIFYFVFLLQKCVDQYQVRKKFSAEVLDASNNVYRPDSAIVTATIYLHQQYNINCLCGLYWTMARFCNELSNSSIAHISSKVSKEFSSYLNKPTSNTSSSYIHVMFFFLFVLKSQTSGSIMVVCRTSYLVAGAWLKGIPNYAV
jgi:hypothetical protein